MRSKLRILTIGALAGTFAFAGNIDFETGAPGEFIQTTALREAYAGLGVHFLGTTGANDGGGLLDQSSNFGVNALSGTDFLAFNPGASYLGGGIPRLNEIINFDVAQSFVSIFMSGGTNNDFMRIEAFTGLNGTGGSLGFDQHTAPHGDWSQFSVNASGIRSVLITGPDADGSFVADDLSFSTIPQGGVPEPSTFLLIPAGVAALAALRRHPRWRLR